VSRKETRPETGSKKRASGELPDLSRLELEVMDVVWGLGECSSADVIEAYARKRDLAPTTIRTVLANLRRKGYLEPVPSLERGFRLRALVAREAVAHRTFPSLVRHLFGGSPREAIAWLLKSETIDDAELAEIRRMLAQKRGEKK
jgi:predicted transcriptional regulator